LTVKKRNINGILYRCNQGYWQWVAKLAKKC
jgi:hypothetical protein